MIEPRRGVNRRRAKGAAGRCQDGGWVSPAREKPVTLCPRKPNFGGLDASEVRRLRALEAETTRLKKLLADAMLDNAVQKELTAKKW